MNTNRKDPRTRCFVMRDNRVLTMIRQFDSGNTLLLPGGGIDAAETSMQAVKRELVEELGLVTMRDPIQFYTHTETRPVFKEEREWFKGVDTITDVFDFYIYHLGPTETIEVQEEEWEKFEDTAFVLSSQLESYAKKFNAKMGIGILAAANVLSTRVDLLKNTRR